MFYFRILNNIARKFFFRRTGNISFFLLETQRLNIHLYESLHNDPT